MEKLRLIADDAGKALEMTDDRNLTSQTYHEMFRSMLCIKSVQRSESTSLQPKMLHIPVRNRLDLFYFPGSALHGEKMLETPLYLQIFLHRLSVL